nr:AI-2E family transporter [Nocardioides sp. InS609-2]
MRPGKAAAERAEAAAADATKQAESAEVAREAVETRATEFGAPGKPFERHSPFYIGFFGGVGALLAFWLGTQILAIGSTLILIVVALFLAAGLNPAVEWFQARGLKRSWAVFAVITIVVVALVGFVMAIVPVISDQVAQITQNSPGWLDNLQQNKQVQRLDDKYDVIAKIKEKVEQGDLVSSIFGGALGIGLKVVSTLLNGFVVVVLMLYFLAGLDATKSAIYRLAPASRRPRVAKLGDRVIRSVGGYVSGAFIVALCAGVTSLIFLFVVGLGKYAVALAFVVALLDVIPMIGASIGAVVVTAIGFATDPKIGIACLIFYVVYQQLENYLIYPRVMSRSVDIPGSVTVIAALVGAGLLGVVGALLAIPTAAAVLMLTREIFIRRQDAR